MRAETDAPCWYQTNVNSCLVCKDTKSGHNDKTCPWFKKSVVKCSGPVTEYFDARKRMIVRLCKSCYDTQEQEFICGHKFPCDAPAKCANFLKTGDCESPYHKEVRDSPHCRCGGVEAKRFCDSSHAVATHLFGKKLRSSIFWKLPEGRFRNQVFRKSKQHDKTECEFRLAVLKDTKINPAWYKKLNAWQTDSRRDDLLTLRKWLDRVLSEHRFQTLKEYLGSCPHGCRRKKYCDDDYGPRNSEGRFTGKDSAWTSWLSWEYWDGPQKTRRRLATPNSGNRVAQRLAKLEAERL